MVQLTSIRFQDGYLYLQITSGEDAAELLSSAIPPEALSYLAKSDEWRVKLGYDRALGNCFSNYQEVRVEAIAEAVTVFEGEADQQMRRARLPMRRAAVALLLLLGIALALWGWMEMHTAPASTQVFQFVSVISYSYAL